MKPTSLFMAVFAGILLAVWWTFKDVRNPLEPYGANEASQQGGY